MEDVRETLETIDGALAVVRKRLSVILGAVIVLTALYFTLVADPLLVSVKTHTLARVMEDVEIIQWGPTEYLIYKVKLSVVLALLTISPLLVHYVLKGARQNLEFEPQIRFSRSGLVLVAAVALALFVAGVLYAYVLMMPLILKFLVMLTPGEYAITYRISSFYDFVALLTIAFGVVFELPLALNIAVRAGLVSYDTLAKRRREAYLGIIILGALLTPPEVVSQLIMALPLILFYEIGLLTLRLTGAASPKNVPS